MAVVNTKSTNISNADASPLVRSSRVLTGAPVLCAVSTAAVAAADEDTSVYRFVRLPSNAVILKIDLFNDAITGGTDYDLGIYQTSVNGGAVVDINAFADAVDLSSARVNPLDVTHEGGGAVPIEDCAKKLYEVLAITTDPQRDYDLALTGVTVGTAAGDITLKVYYTVG